MKIRNDILFSDFIFIFRYLSEATFRTIRCTDHCGVFETDNDGS